MEQFQLLESDRTLKSSREQINNALLTVRSLSSGTTFPTTNLTDGMLCYRTDHNRLYQLADAANNIWTDRITMSIAGTASTADTIPWASIENKPTTYPAEAHAHPYAASATEGGPATKAEALATPRTINGIPFDGTTDITIAIPPTPTAYVIDTWQNDTKGYRLWSDGFIEQWGTTSAINADSYTVNFPKAFTTTNYHVNFIVAGSTETKDGSYGHQITKRTTTSFSAYDFLMNNLPITWYACGF